MAILLESFVDVKTKAHDLIQALQKQGTTRFCFDLGLLANDCTRTYFPFALVPLAEDFTCKRTLVYGDGKKVSINATFGLFRDDFINLEVPHVEILESDYVDFGVIISKYNRYFSIVNALAIYFGYVDAENDKSFILSNSELMKFALVPFTLETDGVDFIIGAVEDELAIQ